MEVFWFIPTQGDGRYLSDRPVVTRVGEAVANAHTPGK